MDGVTWLGEFARWVASWFYRPHLIRANEKGILFYGRGKTKVLEPGRRWWCPAVQDLETVAVVRQPVDLPEQTLMTQDGKEVTASGVVVLEEINDVYKWLVANVDADESIVEVASACLREVIVGKTLKEVTEPDGRKSIDKALTAAAQKELEAFGAKVERMRLTDFSTTKVFTVRGGAPIPPMMPDEE